MTRVNHHNPKKNSSFDISYHMEMLSDQERVGQIKAAIGAYANKDYVFCELGCGTGIFAIYAATKYKHVYAVDIDINVLAIAKENAQRLGLESNITFIQNDALDYFLPKGVKADVVLSETMSTWMATEPQVNISNHAIANLVHSETKYIPQRVINLMELANINWCFGDLLLEGVLPQFTGIKPPRIMTESRMVSNIDLTTQNDLIVDVNTEYKALVGGVINCARIFCIVEFAPGVLFHSTDSLMPITIIPIQNKDTFEVNSGDLVTANVRYQFHSQINDVHVSLTNLSI